MKKVSIVVLLFVYTVAAAQVVAPKSSFGVAVRSGVSYFSYTSGTTDYRSISDKPAFILGASLFHEKQMGSHVVFRTQLSYLERSEQGMWWGKGSVASIDGTTKQIDRYGSLDMALKRLFGKSKLQPFVQVGVRTDVYLNTTMKYKPFLNTIYSESSSVGRNEIYHPVNLSGFLGMGLSMKKWDVGLECNSSLFAVNRPQLYISKQNFRTLNLQVSYRF